MTWPNVADTSAELLAGQGEGQRKLGAVIDLDLPHLKRKGIDSMADEEFWARYVGRDFDEAIGQLAAWEYRYNHERFSMALNGRMPMEKLAAILAPPVLIAASSVANAEWIHRPSRHSP